MRFMGPPPEKNGFTDRFEFENICPVSGTAGCLFDAACGTACTYFTGNVVNGAPLGCK
jgi:hypothetical protein